MQNGAGKKGEVLTGFPIWPSDFCILVFFFFASCPLNFPVLPVTLKHACMETGKLEYSPLYTWAHGYQWLISVTQMGKGDSDGILVIEQGCQMPLW